MRLDGRRAATKAKPAARAPTSDAVAARGAAAGARPQKAAAPSPPEVVEATFVRRGHTQISIRGHQVLVDKPAPAGQDLGPMASEYLLAALASCTLTTAEKIAEKRKAPFRELKAKVEGTFTEAGLFDRIKLTFTVASDAPKEAWETVLRLTERSCTIRQSLKVPIDEEIVVSP